MNFIVMIEQRQSLNNFEILCQACACKEVIVHCHLVGDLISHREERLSILVSVSPPHHQSLEDHIYSGLEIKSGLTNS
ncbi:hypothetical protein WOLCODRAFT_23576, partial [Wolfiporia cocos MD-104 SS10]